MVRYQKRPPKKEDTLWIVSDFGRDAGILFNKVAYASQRLATEIYRELDGREGRGAFTSVYPIKYKRKRVPASKILEEFLNRHPEYKGEIKEIENSLKNETRNGIEVRLIEEIPVSLYNHAVEEALELPSLYRNFVNGVRRGMRNIIEAMGRGIVKVYTLKVEE